jgi:hypothetical protein
VAEDWGVRLDLQALAGSFQESVERDRIANVGVFVHADYLEQAGLSLGYNRTTIDFFDNDADIDQDQLFLSGRFSLTPDWAGGRIGFRLDGHRIDNNDEIGDTGDLNIIAPQISYTNLAKSVYFDLGYARSSYGESNTASGDLILDQLTPTLGFGWSEGRNWLQLRGFLIDASNPDRTQGKDNTSAVEAKWSHWFNGPGPLRLEKIVLSALGGERLFGVDPDSAVVYNVADIQTGSAAIAGHWRFNDKNRFLMQVGYEGYTNEVTDDDYNAIYLYLNYTHLWD